LGKCVGCFFSKNRRIRTAHVVETGMVGKSAGLL